MPRYDTHRYTTKYYYCEVKYVFILLQLTSNFILLGVKMIRYKDNGKHISSFTKIFFFFFDLINEAAPICRTTY